MSGLGATRDGDHWPKVPIQMKKKRRKKALTAKLPEAPRVPSITAVHIHIHPSGGSQGFGKGFRGR